MFSTQKFRTFLSLSSSERSRVMEALLLPVLVFGGFRAIGVPRTQHILRRWANRARLHSDTFTAVEQIRGALLAQKVVQRSTGVAGNCLVRSLTLWAILLRRGIVTELRVGFRRFEGRIQGHAWIEYQGRPINESLTKARLYAPYDGPMSFDLARLDRRKTS